VSVIAEVRALLFHSTRLAGSIGAHAAQRGQSIQFSEVDAYPIGSG